MDMRRHLKSWLTNPALRECGGTYDGTIASVRGPLVRVTPRARLRSVSEQTSKTRNAACRGRFGNPGRASASCLRTGGANARFLLQFREWLGSAIFSRS